MIAYLQREIDQFNGRLEVNIRIAGSKNDLDEVIVAADETGIVIDRNGIWRCYPWHQIDEISKPIIEPDYAPTS